MATRNNRQHFALRTRIILGVILAVAVLLMFRLYFLQVVYGGEYRTQASGQYISTTGGFYNRGSIFFKDKDGREVSGATIKTGYTLAIDPRSVKDPEVLYTALSPYLSDTTRETFLARAKKSEDPYEELERQLTKEQRDAIKELDLPGVVLSAERWRYYPGETLAAHTLGFVAYEDDTINGRYGLERYYEDVLTRGESNLYVNFFAELFTNLRDVVFVPVQKREGSIVTTIDPTIQLQLEQILLQTHTDWNSKMSGGIVVDPMTGAVKALAVSPSFNLNDFSEARSSDFGNPLIENVYELGSIVKPLTVAAGIDAGVISPSTTYNDRGSLTRDGYTISNFDGRARGVVSMQEVLSQSLNTGVAFVVGQLGNDAFRRYMYRLGINEETGIDLPNEAHSLTENLNSPRDIEYVTASFGQGIALTPINMVRALSALPDGHVEQPHLISEIRSRNGISHAVSYDDVRERVFSDETAEEITRMLVEVVDEALLGGSVKIENYSVAAKTGTAQIASPDGGYYDDRFLHSFFGYFPAYEPQYLVFLMNVEPQGALYASQTLTAPFMEMTHFLINYADIPPDR